MDVCVLTIYFLLVLEEGADSSMSSVCQSGNLITCQFYSSWKCGGILSLYFFFFFFFEHFLTSSLQGTHLMYYVPRS